MVHKNVWLISFILLIMTIGTASAGGLNILSIGGDNQGTTGNFAVVYINTTGADNIGSLQLEVLYDPSVISANNVNAESLATGALSTFGIDNTTGKITVGIITTTGITGDGSLAKINFSIVGLAGSSSSLDINLVDATDSGNVAIVPSEIVNGTFTVEGDAADDLPPVINSVTLNTSTPNTGDSLLVTVDATDDTEVIGVSANGVELSLQDGKWLGTIVAEDGTHTVNVSAGDAVGNVAWDNSTSYTATSIVDDILSPVINSVVLNKYTPNTGDNVLITVSAEDNVGVVNVVADVYGVSNVGVSNVAIDHIELSQVENLWSGTIVARNGTYSVQVSASDAAGNVAWNNSTSYRAADKPALAFEFGVSNLALTVEQDVIATYTLKIKNTGRLYDAYDLTVDNPNGVTVNLSNESAYIKPGNSYSATLKVSSSTVGKYVVNVTATSRKNPSGGNIAISTETTVTEPSYIKAFHVENGNRSGSIKSYVRVTNLDDTGHWFVVVIGGIDPLTGYPLVGTGTLYLGAGETADKVPVLITVPASADVGVYQLYAGIYNYDEGLLDQSTLLGTIQGPEQSAVS